MAQSGNGRGSRGACRGARMVIAGAVCLAALQHGRAWVGSARTGAPASRCASTRLARRAENGILGRLSRATRRLLLGPEGPDAAHERILRELHAKRRREAEALAIERSEWRRMREVFWEEQQDVAEMRRGIVEARRTASRRQLDEALYRHSLALAKADRTQERVVLKKRAVDGFSAPIRGIERQILEVAAQAAQSDPELYTALGKARAQEALSDLVDKVKETAESKSTTSKVALAAARGSGRAEGQGTLRRRR